MTETPHVHSWSYNECTCGVTLLAYTDQLETKLIATQKELADFKENTIGVCNAWKRDYEGARARGDAWMADCKKAEQALALRGEPVAICEAIVRDFLSGASNMHSGMHYDAENYLHAKAAGAGRCVDALRNAAPISGERVTEPTDERIAQLEKELEEAVEAREYWVQRYIDASAQHRVAEQALALRGEPVANITKLGSLIERYGDAMYEAGLHINPVNAAGKNYTHIAEDLQSEVQAELEVMCAAVSGERVSEAVDARRWQRFCELWAASTELSASQDESGFWIIRQIEAAENETFGALVGETPDDAIDKALQLAAQPEGK